MRAETTRNENHLTSIDSNENSLKSLLPKFLRRLLSGENLTQTESGLLFEILQCSTIAETHIAAALSALSTKGETIEELTGLIKAMRERATHINSIHANFIDTAGTGAGSIKTFNISTAAAFVIAGAGLPVAKHGNRAATSNSGSADVLTALGVNIAVEPEIAQKCLNEIGICFMFAPKFHSLSPTLGKVRRELGVPTTFNLLGPLANPAKAPFQIVGVYRADLVEKMAQTLANLGTKRAFVVHGSDGLDEITLNCKTFVAEVKDGRVRQFEVSPADFGLENSPVETLHAKDAENSAQIIRQVLQGERRDAARDIVAINAAAALFIGGAAESLTEAAAMAAGSIDSGAALEKLNKLISETNEISS